MNTWSYENYFRVGALLFLPWRRFEDLILELSDISVSLLHRLNKSEFRKILFLLRKLSDAAVKKRASIHSQSTNEGKECVQETDFD